MPRVGSTPEEQTSGGSSFSFGEGRGRIVACMVSNDQVPGFPPPKCGYKITIQRLDAKGQPDGSEPITEHLAAGPVEKFHPGQAASSDDASPDLEFGAAKDCGDQDQAEGTCLLSGTGAGPDKKGKLSIFSNSCIQHGVKASLFNGYAPNLVGLDAHFTAFMMEKGKDYKGKNDPTCLIIGAGGQVVAGKIYAYPSAQTGAPAAVLATSKANGVPAAPVAAPAAVGGAVDLSADNIASKAVETLQLIQAGAPGQTIDKTKLSSRTVVIFAKENKATPGSFPLVMHKPINELLKNDAWLTEMAGALGWVVNGNQVTLPAAQ